MIYLFTDFGSEGPYLGQVQAVLHRAAPGLPIVNLFSDLPPFSAMGAAYLLAAYTRDAGVGDVVLAVVDPGVGTERDAVVVAADGRWFVGPDNGLLAIVGRRARHVSAWSIAWRPERMSVTFHGRDLFAPVAAALASGGVAAAGTMLRPLDVTAVLRPAWPDDLPALVYFDRYGNALTGLRAAVLDTGDVLTCGGHEAAHAQTFAAGPRGQPFWYENANGLAELAVNQESAQRTLGLQLGMNVRVTKVMKTDHTI